MLDVDHGRISYGVLAFGGFLGLGEKLFAIPWEALSLDTSDHKFILNVDRATLGRAEGFDPNDWPDMADPEWGRRIYSYYGYEPYWS
jgi:hypothetical protein